MKNKTALPFILFVCTALVGITSVVVRVLLTGKYLDTAYGVYQHGAVPPIIYHGALAIAIILLTTAALAVSRSYPKLPAPAAGDLTTFTACISAFMLAASSLLSLYNVLVAKAAVGVFDILLFLFSVPAIVFFIAIIRSGVKPSAGLVFTSFFPTAWCAAYLIRIYFDTTLLITSPGKTMNELALLAAMLYFLNESRFLLGKSSNFMFTASASVASILLLTVSIPSLILSDALLIGESDNYICYAVECAFALFILTRFYTFSRGSASPDDLTGDDGGIGTLKA